MAIRDRFAPSTRQAVSTAQAEALELGHARVGTQHLLLGLLAQDSRARIVLSEQGLTAASLRRAISDDAALRGLGIDPDAVGEAVDESFGTDAMGSARRLSAMRDGNIFLSAPAKTALKTALMEAVERHLPMVEPPMLLLGIIDEAGAGCEVLRDLGVDPDRVRDRVVAELADGP